MQELDEIQLRSNTNDARTGRNTNTSILVAADMHATETMNQQWAEQQLPCGVCIVWVIVWVIKSVHLRDTLYAPDDAVDMECHISVVDHKTTRLCIVLSAHGSTQAKCIRSNGRIQIRSNTKDARTGRNATKIQHKSHPVHHPQELDEIQIHRSS